MNLNEVRKQIDVILKDIYEHGGSAVFGVVLDNRVDLSFCGNGLSAAGLTVRLAAYIEDKQENIDTTTQSDK